MLLFFLFMFLFLLAPLGLVFQGISPPKKQINFWNLLFQELDKREYLGLLWPWLVLYERVFIYQKGFYPIALLLSLSSLGYNLYLKTWALRWGVLGDRMELLPWWIWILGLLLTLIRVNLQLCQPLYGALWVWRPGLMEGLLEKPWLFVKEGPFKLILRQAWHHYQGPKPNLAPRSPDGWNKTHIAVGICTATLGLGLAGSVAYDTHLTRQAAEKAAEDGRLVRQAAEKAAEDGRLARLAAEKGASASEVSAGLKSKEAHWDRFGKE